MNYPPFIVQCLIELLFSTNIPKDIADKYNYFKQQTFENLGIPYQPGVVTYVAPPQSILTNSNGAAAASINDRAELNGSYSNSNYTSTGTNKRLQSSSEMQLFTQLEEILKSLTEHSANMTKGIVLEEDNSFIQDSLSKKFLEPLNKKDYHFTQMPKEFLGRVDQIKAEFDQSIRKMIEHFNQQKEEIAIQNDRKIDLLKQEASRYKLEIQNIRNQQDRQCMCKYYEETVDKMKEDHSRYVEKLKKKYESEIYDIRNKSQNFDAFRDKLFSDINHRVLSFVQDKYNPFLHTYCTDNNLQIHQVDPIELLFYICQRLQGDNNWLVDKLAEVQTQQTSIPQRDTDSPAKDLLNSQLFSDLIEQTRISQEVMDVFNAHHQDLMANLHDQNTNKENIPLKKHSYSSVSNLRESHQSNQTNGNNQFLNKSQSGKTINLKYQQIMRMSNGAGSEEYDSIESNQKRNPLGDSSEYYKDQYK